MELLLLSNSSSDAGYLVHAQAAIRDLAAGRKTACFIPFAGVTRDWDTYETLVRGAFAPVGIAVQSLHRLAEPAAAVRAIEAAELIVVGGGNTFRLLQCLRERGLLAAISARVRSGAARYIGWSAGANLACPTIRTTNDMPVADPGGLDALALVPFQINPHYFNLVVPGFRGERATSAWPNSPCCSPTCRCWACPKATGCGSRTIASTWAAPMPRDGSGARTLPTCSPARCRCRANLLACAPAYGSSPQEVKQDVHQAGY